MTVGTAEQTSAPALLANPERVTAAWVGTTETGVQQDAAAIVGGVQTPVVTLPLPPTFPHRSELFPAAGQNNAHLLWLDIDGENTSQLYTAVIDETLGVFRGPVVVSQDGTACYDAFADPDGTLHTVWYGGEGGTRGFRTAVIEPTGLLVRRQEFPPGGGCPTAVQTLRGRYVLWIADGNLHTAPFFNGFVSTTRQVGQVPTLRDSDRLRSLRGGSDGDRVYAFYNITRADGTDETWFASGTPERPETWNAPRRLTVIPDAGTGFETTLNTGQTFAATEGVGGRSAAWVAPMRGVTGVLPVAAEVQTQAGTTLAVIYLQDGDVVGTQQIAPVRPLLGTPALRIDRDRHLYLAWSEPSDIGAAHLRITATRQLTNSP